MISCHDTTALISRSMDARLSWRERWAVAMHLAICSACRAFGEQVRFLREACRRYSAGGSPPGTQ